MRILAPDYRALSPNYTHILSFYQPYLPPWSFLDFQWDNKCERSLKRLKSYGRVCSFESSYQSIKFKLSFSAGLLLHCLHCQALDFVPWLSLPNWAPVPKYRLWYQNCHAWMDEYNTGRWFLPSDLTTSVPPTPPAPLFLKSKNYSHKSKSTFITSIFF